MPSALETLVKILKLEQDTGYKNTAVIGGLQSYAGNWAREAHNQAKRPEHHQLVDELVSRLNDYGDLEGVEPRHEAIKYMIGRITGRIAPPSNLPPSTYEPPAVEEQPPIKEPETPPQPAPERMPQQAAPRAPEPTQQAAPQRAPQRHAPEPPRAPTRRTPPPAPSSIEPMEDDSDDEISASDDYELEIVATLASDMVDETANIPTILPPTAPPRRPRRAALSSEEIAQRLEALKAPIIKLPKIGVKMAEKLNKLGIETIGDMLYSFPRRYDDYTRLKTLNRVQPGEVVTVVAEVRSVTKHSARGGQPYLMVTLDDDTRPLQVTFFGQPWLQRQFKRGSRVVLSGEMELFRGQLMMTNPEWEMLERDNLHTRRIVPVYPLTKGLSARTMRRLMHQVVMEWNEKVPDHMPESVLERANLADLGWSIQQIHFPESYEYLAHARTRLSFDELFLFQMGVLASRRDWQSVPGIPISVTDDWLQSFVGALPYPLTNAQQRVLAEIRTDISRDVPMNRLLQGDVGSGKTVVAVTAMAIAVNQGKQAALMAPTSILAEQHLRSISQLLNQTPGGDQIQVRLLTGNTNEQERSEIYRGLAEGWVHIIIGTHAVIQENVNFHDLGLAIIDEQHRFGVEQRGALRGKGTNPHILVMTATPIPRTLALTLYADLDLSVIDEMPPGRTPVDTRIIYPAERERAYSFIRSQLDQGRQAFIVYPLVESSDKLEDVGAAVDEYERLKQQEFPKHRIGLLHGRMKPSEKEEIMQAFSAGDIQVLVSTSVVEVGIDVPNASTILIENADRFGLAQLHQFRGRVGRGEHASYCLLVSSSKTPGGDERLQAMEKTTDGFQLAQIDWEMRGAGDLLGVRQSGVNQFRLAELVNPRLVELAGREARTVYAEDPQLAQPEHQLLGQRIYRQQDRRADVS